jgi:translation initiation factor 2 beta subunit (eIF-2beta)/eIF-5
MADCCSETKKKLEMKQFVRQKATNFKTLLSPFCITPDQKDFLLKYNEDDLENLVKQYLAPLYATGTLLVAREAIISNLSITDDKIKDKIQRYLECFCECILDDL